jgi:hypothetical protein
VRAAARVEAGADATSSLREARAAFEKASSINPRSGAPFLGRGCVAMLEARQRIAYGRSPDTAFEEAARSLAEAIRLDSNNARTYLAMAELRREQASWRQRRGEDPRHEIADGVAMAERAVTVCPQLGRAMAVRAALLRCEAESTQDHARRRGLLERARESLGGALARNAHLARRYEGEREAIEAALAAL